jgi:5-methylcytosine-specific restriction enzyme A
MPHRPASHRPPGADQARQARRQEYDRDRAGLESRLLYSTARFRRFRRWLLTRRPICQDCQHAAALDVHHCRGLAAHPDDLCDPQQTLTLCHQCHSRRTAKGG